MRKKGAGNVEFILAFILFISFTATALYFINPIRDTKILQDSRDFVARAIIRNVSVQLDSYSVVITAPKSETALKVYIPGVAENENARVTDYYAIVIYSEKAGEDVCIQRQNNENFSIIYFSEDIDGATAASCSGSSEYQIASSITERVLSEKRIVQLKDAYNSDYDLLRKSLGVPSGTDFSFSFEFPGGQPIKAEKNAVIRGEVFSGTNAEEVLSMEGDLKFGDLTVRIW